MKGRTGQNRVFTVSVVLVLLFVLVLGALAEVLMPSTGSKVISDGSLTIDCSNASSGYVMMKAKKSQKRLKVRVKGPGGTLNYDLNTDGEYEVFPLQYGNGSYSFTLYKNVSGKKYSEDGHVNVKAQMEDELTAFLYPNQYVNYTADCQAVVKAAELCEGLTGQKEKFKVICKFINSQFAYDFIKSVTISGTVLPDIDGSFTKRMGICQDLAAIAVCMMRSQGIPTKLMVGMLNGNTYHAWTVAVVDGEEILYDPTNELNPSGKKPQYSLERWY